MSAPKEGVLNMKRRAALLLVGLLAASPAPAQIVRTRTGMITDDVARQGTITSASVTPINTSGTFALEVTLTQANVADPANVITYTMEGSDDGAVWYKLLGPVTWRGGVLDRDGVCCRQPQPHVTTSLRPRRIRLVLDMPRSQRIKADLLESDPPARAR